jgi:hypothetical protein
MSATAGNPASPPSRAPSPGSSTCRSNAQSPTPPPAQVRAWDPSIPWLQRECRELEVRDTAAHEYTAILEYELPRDSRRPDVIVLEHGAVAVRQLKGALFPTRAALHQALGYARERTCRAYSEHSLIAVHSG